MLMKMMMGDYEYSDSDDDDDGDNDGDDDGVTVATCRGPQLPGERVKLHTCWWTFATEGDGEGGRAGWVNGWVGES